ncbi:hypothetical protein [Pseudomonas oryzihabitans]|uniref:hypothetical protein n=1 Tax=Pseudomonas oryzihabitans TaxID=47885 RepID=UPI003EBC5F44
MIKNDTIDLVKADGATFADLKASVQGNKLYLDAQVGHWRLEAGDSVIHHQGDGTDVTYEVINPGYRQGLAVIPAHYQADIKRQ